uniref:ER membrane protein complex subunit 7 beta-sandwich domain-containing protein n=2 Tax=Clytia hemisphaerica TaxID=252671 RepID=A0A7M5UF63_9CNID
MAAKFSTISFVFFLLFQTSNCNESESSPLLFKIEGKVSVSKDRSRPTDWQSETSILVDSGAYKGFLKSDGTFVINNIPSGSYIVEVASANYLFDRFRVDINKGGKIRARQLNLLQPKAVHVVPYPLRFVASKPAPFFEIRETMKVTDFLFNPMVIMMVLPLIFVVIMPKMMSMADPEAQKEMQEQMGKYNQPQIPELSEMFSNMFAGGAEKKRTKPSLASSDRGPAKRSTKRPR